MMAISLGVGKLFGAFSGKKRANAQQELESKQYQDQIETYYKEQAAEEDKRLQKVRLVTSFAQANGMDKFLTPEMLNQLMKRREAIAPPPYRKGGTPGFGWDLAGGLVQSGMDIYGANRAAKAAKAGLPNKGYSPTPKPYGPPPIQTYPV